MSHDAAMELTTAGAVLGDLGPEERLSYAAHRRWCLDCRRLERDLDEVLADVALAAPPREVPAGVLAAVLGEIRGESAVATGPMAAPAAAAARVSSTAVAGAGRRPFLGALALAAGLAIAVVGLGARDVARQQQLAAAEATVASLESELAGRDGAMTVAMDPGRVAVALHPEAVAPGARAAVVYLPGTRAAWIVARDLPATPAGSAYQLWFADGAGVHPLEMVPFDGHGPFIAPIDVDLGGAAAVMITLERSTGAQGEPGPQVVFGEL